MPRGFLDTPQLQIRIEKKWVSAVRDRRADVSTPDQQLDITHYIVEFGAPSGNDWREGDTLPR